MAKKYIQYDNKTGDILATTSGKLRKGLNGARIQEKPDYNLLPSGVSVMEVEEGAETNNKMLDLESMSIVDIPKNEFDLFKEAWPYTKIIEYVQGGNRKRKEFISAVNEITLSTEP